LKCHDEVRVQGTYTPARSSYRAIAYITLSYYEINARGDDSPTVTVRSARVRGSCGPAAARAVRAACGARVVNVCACFARARCDASHRDRETKTRAHTPARGPARRGPTVLRPRRQPPPPPAAAARAPAGPPPPGPGPPSPRRAPPARERRTERVPGARYAAYGTPHRKQPRTGARPARYTAFTWPLRRATRAACHTHRTTDPTPQTARLHNREPINVAVS
jgi:hypothetical protein